jgi:hypothetical protein
VIEDMIAIPTPFGNHYVRINDITALRPLSDEQKAMVKPEYIGLVTEVQLEDDAPILTTATTDELYSPMNGAS